MLQQQCGLSTRIGGRLSASKAAPPLEHDTGLSSYWLERLEEDQWMAFLSASRCSIRAVILLSVYAARPPLYVHIRRTLQRIDDTPRHFWHTYIRFGYFQKENTSRGLFSYDRWGTPRVALFTNRTVVAQAFRTVATQCTNPRSRISFLKKKKWKKKETRAYYPCHQRRCSY